MIPYSTFTELNSPVFKPPGNDRRADRILRASQRIKDCQDFALNVLIFKSQRTSANGNHPPNYIENSKHCQTAQLPFDSALKY
jgi:hypothetical protein